MSRMQGNALPKGAQAPNYAGIDVCKDWLDAKLRPSDKAMRVANDASGHKRLSRFGAALDDVHGRRGRRPLQPRHETRL